MNYQNARERNRPGKVIILFALMLVFLLLTVAFAVDIGWITLTKNHLQVAADAAALAAAAEMINGQRQAMDTAKAIAGENIAGGPTEYVSLPDSDIIFGTWNSGTKTFTANTTAPNAVQVTTRKTLPLFFARVIGMDQRNVQATAIAVANPRDIAFIVDLSGSMNNDGEIWATDAINGAFNGYPTIGTELMQTVYDDFGFGTYPGTVKQVGQGFIPEEQLGTNAYGYLANTYLTQSDTPLTYKINTEDGASTRKSKVYKWIIDKQLAEIMPDARPTPSTSNLAYWTEYLDYVIKGKSGTYNAPNNQQSYRISSGSGNPYSSAWPNLSNSAATQFENKLGYQTYVQFMMDHGWNRKVDNKYVPLSRLSPDCPWRMDNDPRSPGYGLYFPPREQPTHAVRLAIMAAIDKIAQLNAGLPEATKDHVCVITFDTAAGINIRYPLSVNSCDYTATKASVRDMQAVEDEAASTASENGLILARQHLDPAQNSTGARAASNKVLIFLSDGLPNVKQSSNTTIDNYISNNMQGEWFTSGSATYHRNAVLMQIHQLQALGWKTHAVGVGLGADRDLMDRMARMAGTALKDPLSPNGPKISPYAEGNPADYQARLTNIFNTIVGAPNIRLVK